MPVLPRATGAACAATLTAAGLLAAALPAHAASTTVVISEVYGGGGNSGAPFTHDFVELGNASDAPVDLTRWTVRYFSASGGAGGSTPLTGSIPAHATYLVQQGAGAGSGAALPTPDATGTLSMSASSGRVDVYDASGTLVDRVGYGSATTFEGAPTPGLSNTTSAARASSFADTDVNAADFTVGAPTPRPSAGDGGGGGTDPQPPAVTPIAEIQGAGAQSPLVGTRVTTTGVVTAAYPTGGFDGAYLQTPGSGGSTDATPGASDGIFVYGAASATVGQCYTVTGTVAEYYGLTQLSSPTLTPASGCSPVAATPLASLPETDAEKEPFEGMLVDPAGTYTITNNYALNQYGQLGLAAGDTPLRQATDAVAPGAEATAYESANQRRAVTLDDGSSWDYLRNPAAQASPLPYLSQEEPMRTGSHVRFTRPVILDYRYQWNFQPTGQVVGTVDEDDPVASENDREAVRPAVGGDVQVGFFNVLNYFTDLGEAEDAAKGCVAYRDRTGTPVTANGCEVRGAWTTSAFQDQQAKIVSAINATGASVLGLSEIENSAGLTWIGHDRDASLRRLVEALNAAGGHWAYAPSPTVTPDGEDVIRTAFIYDPRRVVPRGASQILLDPAFANARYPFAQMWRVKKTPTTFVTVVNHFKSKGSGEDDGTGQGLSNPAREAQAKALTTWTGSVFKRKAVFLLGDFNAYTKETPLQIVEAAGYRNVVKAAEPTSASYQFSGRVGSLDHVFANPAAHALVTGAGVWDINADEAVAMQYSRRNYNVTDFHTTLPYAASDHDPVLVGVRATPASPAARR